MKKNKSKSIVRLGKIRHASCGNAENINYQSRRI